jgi:hypothetical protein
MAEGYQLAIISDGDAPEARMVALIRTGAGVSDWTYVSTAKMLSRYRKWTRLNGKGWHTPIERFGVVASVRGNRLRIEPSGESTATYPDGVPRKWQGALPGETDIRPALLRRVAIATGAGALPPQHKAD